MSVKQQERVLTRHPADKQGVRMERAKYDQMRRGLLRVIPARGDGVPFKELTSLVTPHLTETIFPPGAGVTWYVVAVKQDLEARGEIEIVPRSRPQRLRKTKGTHR